jgi:glycosyltransferase involved in cell wall biosynthesis
MLTSVIIPFYNAEKYIGETLDSVLNQSYPKLEIICVNNNSTDKSLEILTSYEKKHENIFVYHEKKKGASHARNKGLQYAKGEFIQFLDADDIILPEKIERQIAHAIANDLDVVVSDRTVMNESMTESVSKINFSEICSNLLPTAIHKIITSGNPIYHIETVKKVGGYTAHLPAAQDWDFHIKLIKANAEFGYLEGDFFHSRSVSNSLSSNWFTPSKCLTELIELNKHYFKENKVESNFDAFRKIVHVYLFTAIHCKDEATLDFCKRELKFWKNKHFKFHQTISGLNSLTCRFLGVNTLIALRRLISKQSN